jgi:hypothetical protein
VDLNSFAKLDLRYDYAVDETVGYQVNSFTAIKPMIDHIKSQGYTGIQLQTNVPINLDTGKIDTVVESDLVTPDRSLPDDFWTIAQYASDVGLDVAVRPDPVENVDDEILMMSSNLGVDFSVDEFFNSLLTYETELAANAELAGVDMFYVGVMNFGFEEYTSKWQQVIDSVRGVFSGKLVYVSSFNSGYTPVYDQVDVISLVFDPRLSKTASYDIKEIVDAYRNANSSENGGTSDIVAAVKAIRTQGNKPIILEDVRFDAGNDALGNYIDYYSSAFSNIVIDQQPNTVLQTTRIHAFFAMLKTQLDGVVDAVSPREYLPWMRGDWIANSEGPNGAAMHQLSINGFDLYAQPQAEKAFSYFLKQDNQPIIGTADADTLWVYAGDHLVDGADGVDTADFFNPFSYCEFLVSDSAVTVQNWIDGTVTLSNVERFSFSDTVIALDVDGTAGQAYRIYRAAFDRDPMVDDAAGLGYWIAQMDAGMSLFKVAARFIDSAEFRSLYGAAPTNGEFLTRVYNNVLDRDPDSDGYAWWMDQLANNPEKTWQKVLADFSESSENQANVAGLIGNGITYDAWTG